MPAKAPAEPVEPAVRQKARPLMVGREDAAALHSASPASWDRWTAAGLTPAPVKLGGKVLWCRAELAAWAAHKCPPRKEWAAIWNVILAAKRTVKDATK